MSTELAAKEQNLEGILKAIRSCVIAYSGGLDSTFLGVMASRHVPGRVLCVLISDPSTPEADLKSAMKAARQHGLELKVVSSDIHANVRRNSRDRCYHCKQCLFARLEAIRQAEGLEAMLDGENASDALDDRPGSKAARESGARSPLAEAGLAKGEIRELARAMGLEQWDRPQSACLSSRVPFGTEIQDAVLKRVDKTEEFIRSKGIRMIRARVEGRAARLELGQEENTETNRALLKALEPEIKLLGWSHVEIDPTGYIPAGLRRQKNVK